MYFVDHDDWLGDEALERLHAYAVANDADIVIGKWWGSSGRSCPQQLFRANVPHATLAKTSLMDSLTPHKMFRRAFLAEHDLTFPEGRRRLEDHVFVVSAYLHARTISVLSDYPCYFHTARDDGGNAGFRPLEPVGYFANLRDALDAVDALTEPGPLRDRLHRRWLRVEMVGRLRGQTLLRAAPDYRAELLEEIRKVMAEYFAPGVAAGLAPSQRLVAELAREGDLEGLMALAEWETTTAVRATLERLAWDGATLRLTASAALVGDDGTPVTLRDGRLVVPLPETTLAALPPGALDFSDGRTLVDLSLRHRTSGDERFLATASATVATDGGDDGGGDGAAVGGSVDAAVDPAAVSGGQPLARGIWDVWVKVRAYGWERATKVGIYRAPGVSAAVRPALVGTPPLVVTPYWTEPGNLALDVDQSTRKTATALRPDPERSSVHTRGGELEASLRLPLQLGEPVPASVRLTSTGREPVTLTRPGRLVPAPPGAATLDWSMDSGAVRAVPWRLAVRLTERDGAPWTALDACLLRPRGQQPVLVAHARADRGHPVGGGAAGGAPGRSRPPHAAAVGPGGRPATAPSPPPAGQGPRAPPRPRPRLNPGPGPRPVERPDSAGYGDPGAGRHGRLDLRAQLLETATPAQDPVAGVGELVPEVRGQERHGVDGVAPGEDVLRHLLGVRHDVLGVDLVVGAGQHPVAGVGAEDQQLAGRRGVDRDAEQVGAVLRQRGRHLVDVTGPGVGVPVAGRLVHRAGQHVVQDHDAGPAGVPLGVEHVAQGVLEQVQPVDEGQVHHPAAQRAHRPGPGEEVVAGRLDQLEVAVQRRGHLEGRVDRDGAGARQGEAAAVVHADLEVGARTVDPVQALEELISVHARLLG